MNKMKKYELTDEKIEANNGTTVLFRIKALIDFEYVKAGDLGGFIEKEDNLSHEGNAWVTKNAWVSGSAWVSGNAWVTGYSWVSGSAWVTGNSWLSENSMVTGNAIVSGNAWVTGKKSISKSDSSDSVCNRIEDIADLIGKRTNNIKGACEVIKEIGGNILNDEFCTDKFENHCKVIMNEVSAIKKLLLEINGGGDLK